MERRLAAILAADVVGYTRLMGDDEAGTLERLTAIREQILKPLITRHHGRIVKLMGDGLLVEFASVVDAVACALVWQEAITECEAEGSRDHRGGAITGKIPRSNRTEKGPPTSDGPVFQHQAWITRPEPP